MTLTRLINVGYNNIDEKFGVFWHQFINKVFKEIMDKDIERDIALDIIEEMIAREPLSEDKTFLHELMVMRDEIFRNNTAVIEHVMKEYKKAVNPGENNGNK